MCSSSSVIAFPLHFWHFAIFVSCQMGIRCHEKLPVAVQVDFIAFIFSNGCRVSWKRLTDCVALFQIRIL